MIGPVAPRRRRLKRAMQVALVGYLLAGRAAEARHRARAAPMVDYRGDRQRAEAITPLGWTVTGLLPIESPVGQIRHVDYGRWPLHDV